MGIEPTTLCGLPDTLTTELLETVWRERMKCGSLAETHRVVSQLLAQGALSRRRSPCYVLKCIATSRSVTFLKDGELIKKTNCAYFSTSMTYDRDSGHKSFLEDVFENESRLPGGSWGPSSVPWTDVVSIFFFPHLYCHFEKKKKKFKKSVYKTLNLLYLHL